MIPWPFLIMSGCRMAGISTCGSAGQRADCRWCFTTGRRELPPRCGRWNAQRTRVGFAW
jgi:hypothetical protein